MGEYYSFTNSQPDSESFTVFSVVKSVRNILSVTVGDICISSFQSSGACFDAHAGKFTSGNGKSSQQTQAMKGEIRKQRLSRLDLVFVRSPISSSQFAGKTAATTAEDWPYLGDIFALECRSEK